MSDAVTSDFSAAVQFYRSGSALRARAAFEKLSEDGDADSLAMLGYMLERGEGGEADPARAGECYRRAVEAQHPGAAANLARMILEGRLPGTGRHEALGPALVAASAVPAEITGTLAPVWATGLGDTELRSRGRELLEASCLGGSAVACRALGMGLEVGSPSQREPESAARWFRVGAEAGDAACQFNLGLLLDRGDGLPRDGAEAVRWYEHAARNGVAQAQHNLAVLVSEGDGVARDQERAFFWVTISAARGVKESHALRQRIFPELHLGRVAELEAQAAAWTPGDPGPAPRAF